ncbi:hypothetical protein HAX54_044441, partial [Datura stramonium]|nr:hypothetical protein [Datura stramonium]
DQGTRETSEQIQSLTQTLPLFRLFNQRENPFPKTNFLNLSSFFSMSGSVNQDPQTQKLLLMSFSVL